jgi:hypothetical protein
MPRFKPTPEKPFPGKAGRPSTYTEQIADEIVNRMIEGESLTAICKDPGMPPRVTVYAWFDKRPDFYARCARAREALADYLVDEIEQLADSATKDNIETVKVQISTKQWRAMKMAPRMYGDRTRTEVTGDNGGPIKVESKQMIDPRDLSEDQREALEAVIQTALKKGSKDG